MGVGTSQIKFGENGLTFMSSRDPAYGDAWMITAPYIILKSNGTVVRTSATGSPAMMGDINALSSSLSGKADKFPVTVTQIYNQGDPTCDKTFGQISYAIASGKHVTCTYIVQFLDGNGEVSGSRMKYMNLLEADDNYIRFGFSGYSKDNSGNFLARDALTIDKWGQIYSLTDGLRIISETEFAALEARVAALEGGN